MDTPEKIGISLQSLVVFRNLLDNEVIKKLEVLLFCSDKSLAEQVNCYADFVAALYKKDSDMGQYILRLVLEDENIYIQKKAQGLAIETALEDCLQNELKILEELSGLTSADVKSRIGFDGYLPNWQNTGNDFLSRYRQRLDSLPTRGYGIFSRYYMFTVKNGVITPVKAPDQIRLSDLKSYEAERQEVIDNTLALLKGKPAANALLYGDAGTGKSSTVKAIANEYKDIGLRLIEIKKSGFADIPVIMEKLSNNPLKFIIFIDDLSFHKDNDDYKSLKAILEGSVAAKTPNIVIYATSNRRHLVRESFTDRDGDDIHRNETIQELVSLSERFGLLVNFFKPDKERYLDIVRQLKTQYGIALDDVELCEAAERYALKHSGRSPRVARQFIEHLLSAE